MEPHEGTCVLGWGGGGGGGSVRNTGGGVQKYHPLPAPMASPWLTCMENLVFLEIESFLRSLVEVGVVLKLTRPTKDVGQLRVSLYGAVHITKGGPKCPTVEIKNK